VTDDPGERSFWETRWEQALREHGDAVAKRPPNARLVAEVAELGPGRALDAGCGHGAESLWLAARGWYVEAVDFSVAALDHARATAEALGEDFAKRIRWVEGDLATFAPEPEAFDLVSCLHVHIAGEPAEFVQRLGRGVAPGGSLFLVGHQPVDPETGSPTAAADQVQVSLNDARAALSADEWDLVVAEERRRESGPSGVDAVIRALRKQS